MPPPILSRTFNGVVVSAGRMQKAVKVRVADQTWNRRIKKYFSTPQTHLVSDPTSSTREGDIVRIVSGWRTSQHIRHVIAGIISPFGTPLSERPPLPTLEELAAQRQKKRLEKDIRQAARGRGPSAQRVKEARGKGLFRKLGIRDPREVERERGEREAKEEVVRREKEVRAEEERVQRVERSKARMEEKERRRVEKSEEAAEKLS